MIWLLVVLVAVIIVAIPSSIEVRSRRKKRVWLKWVKR